MLQNFFKNRKWSMLLTLIGVLLFSTAQPVLADPHPGMSNHVAVTGSLDIINGGTLPALPPFNFYNTPVAGLSLTALQNGTICNGSACDTLVLNVASSLYLGGLGCTTSTLTASQKADINAFVAAGNKVIIYDSECTFGGSVDYSWLAYPFETTNPGAWGAYGNGLIVVEDNILSHSDPTNVHYIDAALLNSTTDAVGDMNVVNLDTVDPNWCLDLTGVNVQNVPGATHMYARYGSGLLIYNGLDVDWMGSYTSPTSSTGPGNLAKLWLQELQAVPDPALLPCIKQVIDISLNPETATNPVGTTHTVTATIEDISGNVYPDVLVTFEVVAGPNTGASGVCSANADCTTDTNGNVSFTYASNGVIGTDTIQASYVDDQGVTNFSRDVFKEWLTGGQAVCDVDNNGAIDFFDIRAILSARGTPASGPTDPADADGDGWITPSDAKLCIQDCDNVGCAP